LYVRMYTQGLGLNCKTFSRKMGEKRQTEAGRDVCRPDGVKASRRNVWDVRAAALPKSTRRASVPIGIRLGSAKDDAENGVATLDHSARPKCAWPSKRLPSPFLRRASVAMRIRWLSTRRGVAQVAGLPATWEAQPQEAGLRKTSCACGTPVGRRRPTGATRCAFFAPSRLCERPSPLEVRFEVAARCISRPAPRL
jgi:hypothetical protein